MADRKHSTKIKINNHRHIETVEDGVGAAALARPPVLYYRLHNLDCADCARKFENAVKKIPGVVDAKVYFATARMKVVGSFSPHALQAAGRLDGIDVLPDGASERLSEAGNRSVWIIALISGASLGIGWFLSLLYVDWSAGLFLAAIIIGGFATFRKGLANIFKLQFDMSVLMSVAVLGAVFIGEWLEGATVAFLFSVSGLLETYTADRARRSLRSLMDMTPTAASVVRGNTEEKIPVDQVRVNDRVLVRPGEKIPVDGVVTEGITSVNQAPITGESVPVPKSEGKEVFAGTINQSGAIQVRVTKESGDTTLAKIVRLVEEAQNKKVKVQSFIDKFAACYTPGVMVLAAVIIVLPPLFWGLEWREWLYRGLALLVVACPCALVITTPVVVVSAVGNAARNGVLIKGGIHLERLREVNIVAIDKTGTLTKGLPAVHRVVAYEKGETEVLMLAGSVERLSEHPLGDAVVRELNKKKISAKAVSEFKIFPGKGAQGYVDGSLVRVGNKKMFSQEQDKIVLQDLKVLEKDGSTVVLVGKEEKIIGLIALEDEIRKDALSAVKILKQKQGIKTVMLTGDSAAAAQTIARRTGIDAVYSEMLPQDKVAKIEALKKDRSVVMMVGDGVNDAPALAAADVSAAMGAVGTDAALEASDIVLMSDDLEKLPFALELSRQSIKVIKQNIAFALGIKLLAILAVFPGWLTLWLAIMADMGANVLVTLNGMRLVRYKSSIPPKDKEVSCSCGGT